MLRSINSAKSAFLAVTFYSRFFESYEVFGNEIIQSAVLAKVRNEQACSPAFRGHHHCLPFTNTTPAPFRPRCTLLPRQNALAIFRSQKVQQISFALDTSTTRLKATVTTEEGKPHAGYHYLLFRAIGRTLGHAPSKPTLHTLNCLMRCGFVLQGW